MHSHEVLKTATYLCLEVRELLNEERMANCSNEHFLLDLVHEFIRYKLEGKHFFTGPMATC
jgi:hypothetical protein